MDRNEKQFGEINHGYSVYLDDEILREQKNDTEDNNNESSKSEVDECNRNAFDNKDVDLTTRTSHADENDNKDNKNNGNLQSQSSNRIVSIRDVADENNKTLDHIRPETKNRSCKLTSREIYIELSICIGYL